VQVKYVTIERDVLNRCRHPNVVRLFCTFQVTLPLLYGHVTTAARPRLREGGGESVCVCV
jgi:hypothetical protein